MNEKKSWALSGALERPFGRIFSWAPDVSAPRFFSLISTPRHPKHEPSKNFGPK